MLAVRASEKSSLGIELVCQWSTRSSNWTSVLSDSLSGVGILFRYDVDSLWQVSDVKVFLKLNFDFLWRSSTINAILALSFEDSKAVLTPP